MGKLPLRQPFQALDSNALLNKNSSTELFVCLFVLFLSCSEAEPASAHQGSFSSSQSPQSVGSGAVDSGAEYLSDSNCYNMDLSMSLCGQESDTRQITKGQLALATAISTS